MKYLVIDGNSVYEIDEDCVRSRRPPKNCEVYQYLKNNSGKKAENDGKVTNKWQKKEIV